MAVRDHEWPGYTQWYCCPLCRRLWTHQDHEMVVLDAQFALGPAHATSGVPARSCLLCLGHDTKSVTSI